MDYAYFAHDSPVTGSPNQLIVALFGYPLAGNTGFYFGPNCSPCVYGSSGNTGVRGCCTALRLRHDHSEWRAADVMERT